jgi:asparagine synthase (glutamine-hydrolysing)
MCGIAGIVMFDPHARADEARLRRMCDAIRHRGPDDSGLWIHGPVGLGHRRLSIVDVASGHQPMTNEDGTVWITFNGEIYNHAEMRPSLEAAGHRYQTRCDTETILHLYEESGDGCVDRLQGMFAFAIWDGARKRLLLARDRLGIKPLYYAVLPDQLLFASEIKAILAAGGIRAELDETILPEFLANRFVSGAETFFRGIRKLLPARTLTWSVDDGVAERCYWRLPVPALDDDGASLAERAAELRERLRATVRSHLMSDVPLGLFLSGGLDSSGIAALMAPLADRAIRTFSVGFSDPEANELAFARRAAQTVGAKHSEIVVSPEQFFAALPTLVWHEDEPIAFTSSVPLYFVSRLAQRHVKVVLTGEGADELFLGYNWYPITAWNERLARAYSRLTSPALRRHVRRSIEVLPAGWRRYARRSFLALEPGLRSLRYENFAVFPEQRRRDLLTDPQGNAVGDPFRTQLRLAAEAGGGSLEAMTYADLQTYLVELLMKQDQMSMAASIESRVPFLDHLLVEHALSIPARYKVSGGRTKLVLREALKDLVPREILTRTKMGFPVPVSRWFREQFGPVVDEFVLGPRTAARGLLAPDAASRLAAEHRAGLEDHGDRLWLLVNLEIWHRIFIDGESPGDVARVCAAQGLQPA